MTGPLANVDVGGAVKKLVGFLEEAPGVKSSTRLFAAILLSQAVVIVAGEIGYVAFCVTRTPPRAIDPTVLNAANVALGIVVAQGVAAVLGRKKSDGGDA